MSSSNATMDMMEGVVVSDNNENESLSLGNWGELEEQMNNLKETEPSANGGSSSTQGSRRVPRHERWCNPQPHSCIPSLVSSVIASIFPRIADK
ncbi:hypothetical protein Q1695_011671 [Nippostrongylus brasiliensis]|nr:hypothetical protein Q1695_011671 [Nippostrongylus brasiliensis]